MRNKQNPALSSYEVLSQHMSCIHRAIRYMERKYECKTNDYYWSEFEQEGRLAVLRAMRTYDSSCGMSLTSYISQTVYFAISDAFRAELGRGMNLDYYDQTIEYGDWTEDYWGQLAADDIYNADYYFSNRETREECEQFLSRLPYDIDREIIRQSYGLNDGFEASYQAIGNNLNISSERVRQRANRAMEQLRFAA